ILGHGPSSKAFRAAVTAASISRSSPLATVVIGSSVAGLIGEYVSPVVGACHRPLTKICPVGMLTIFSDLLYARRRMRPLFVAVNRPRSTTTVPLTITYGMPVGYRCGSAYVDSSLTVAGSKTVTSAA